MCENRIQTFIFDVVYVSETGRIVTILHVLVMISLPI